MLFHFDTLPDVKPPHFVFFFFNRWKPDIRTGVRTDLTFNILLWSTFTLLLQSHVFCYPDPSSCVNTCPVMISVVALDHDGLSSLMTEEHAARTVTHDPCSTSYIYLSLSRFAFFVKCWCFQPVLNSQYHSVLIEISGVI